MKSTPSSILAEVLGLAGGDPRQAAGHSSERTNRCAGEHLLAGVREIVYRRSIPLATQHLAIVQSRAGATAGVLGAASMVTQQILAPAAVAAPWPGRTHRRHTGSAT